MDKSTWVVVANGERARIFEVEKFGQLKEIDTLIHPKSKLSNEELTRDSLGRTTELHKKVSNTYQPATMPKEKELIAFAKQVATHLDLCRNTNKFSKLFLIVDPHFLGLLRKNFGKNTLSSIEGEITKDLTEFNPDQIWIRLPVAH